IFHQPALRETLCGAMVYFIRRLSARSVRRNRVFLQPALGWTPACWLGNFHQPASAGSNLDPNFRWGGGAVLYLGSALQRGFSTGLQPWRISVVPTVLSTTASEWRLRARAR